MESIRVQKDNVFEIEVNDKGETIELDLLDIELPLKFYNASKELEKQGNVHKQKSLAVAKQYADNEEMLIKKQSEVDKTYYDLMRKTFDGFLGDGACNKIFGKTNRHGMFEALIEQLIPIFEKLQPNVEQIKKDLYNKYKPESKEVI